MVALPVQVFKWGIFNVAYEPPRRYLGPDKSPLTLLRALFELSTYVWRFLFDILRIAPSVFFIYAASTAWLGSITAISLHMTCLILQQIEALAREKAHKMPYVPIELIVTISTWIALVVASVLMKRLKEDKELLLCGHLRAHFLPSFAKLSLSADIKFIHDQSARRHFPNSASFSEGGPGWNLLKGLAERSQALISFISESVVVYLVLCQKTLWDRWLLGGLLGLFFLVLIFSPSNGVSGAGYTFWTTNHAFNRLHRLYLIIFDPKFRETLAKDGLNESLYHEYRKCSSNLGVVKSDVITLACVLPPSWYWAVLRSLVLDYPMALCALILPWSSSPFLITTIVFFQSVTNVLGRTFERLQRVFDQRSISQLLAHAQALYRPLDQRNESQRKTVQYSPPGVKKGMDFHVRDVTFRYQGSTAGSTALKKISITIPANSFVLLVGSNGSGKTTLLKLIGGLLEPNSGEILVGGMPLADFEPLSVRKHTTFLMQSEEIYPMSLRENLLMAIPDFTLSKEEIQEKIDEAVQIGGAMQLIDRVGYEAILNPPTILAQSLQGCGNGIIGEAAIRELERNTLQRSAPISSGERQRFLAARSFMRLLNSDTRLLMVDEPTSGLDLVAERNLFEEFYRRSDGKTTIFVTHRFGSLAKQADMIVCMKNGEIVEAGRHDELMRLGGEYAGLYEAQQGIPRA
ncbi:hypothetical protein D9756_001167 [Leucocoprinus leucothites]|uniref:ABC transporter domain-containing protein n=1 Tax=Leucocoprinus leucothites TaxID=201217 RepID=A0A8H5LI66_9AGAR|nr:hypothetical protein D9756_001167 [Leucoagaricus leucothites]